MARISLVPLITHYYTLTHRYQTTLISFLELEKKLTKFFSSNIAAAYRNRNNNKFLSKKFQ